ncbi:MAG: acetylxylan esterase [Adhaeribacter sp.]
MALPLPAFSFWWKRFCFSLLLSFCCGLQAFAQPAPQLVTVKVTADHPDWVYTPGQEVVFSAVVTHQEKPLRDVKLSYTLGPDMMKPLKTDSLVSKDGKLTLKGGTMQVPGFLRCIVTAEYKGKKYRGLATAAFSPEKIKATTSMPADFLDFWNKAKAANARIPLDVQSRLLPERSNEKVNVYEISVQNYQLGSRIYGIACIPKKEGKYPAILTVPGAGIRAYAGDVKTAEKGFITLQIGIHGIPVTMPDSVYVRLAKTEKYKNYRVDGLQDRNQYYFKRVYLGCIRAIDYIFTLPQFDGHNLGVAGGSQGGALTIVTTALDRRVKYCSAFAPALSDLTGYLHGRAGGWPHVFKNPGSGKPALVENSRYYDVANFAQLLQVPGFYSFGFNDETCPSTTMYAAYNAIKAPKELFIAKDAGHWYYPEQLNKRAAWLQAKLTAPVK